MPAPRPLPARELYRRCELKQFDFTTTAELEELGEIIGQQRAVEALEVAVGIRRDGYNLYALGPPGLGKHGMVTRFIEQVSRQQPVPRDWCYVYNFHDNKRPRWLDLPAGKSSQLVELMDQLVQELRAAITAALESDEYRARRDAIEETFKEEQEKRLKDLQKEARKRGIALINTPAGVGFAPVRDDEVLRPKQFDALPEAQKKQIERDIAALQSELQELMQQVPRRIRAGRQQLQQLNREVTTFAVKEPIEEVKRRYRDLPRVIAYLDALEQDVIDHAGDFLQEEQDSPAKAVSKTPLGYVPGTIPLTRYRVNELVDHSGSSGAPFVYEDNPTYQNLLGQAEHVSHMGALTTDFTLIKPGALHRANGGYLLLDARKLLQQPFAWEGLKQALRARQIRIESLGQALGLVSTVSLEPEPIPLDVKVVLIGERLLYYLLCQLDPEFGDLFKIAADFGEDIPWTAENLGLYARLIATVAARNELQPLHRRAVARVIERGARLCDDSHKLTIRIESIADLLREADYWCRKGGKRVIDAAHVDRAVDAQAHRSSRIREQMYEQIVRGTMRIESDGAVVGQLNGLSVVRLGNYDFGRPSRITATVHLGKGDVVDIEREVQLGGPLHSKGVMILAGFLGERFGQHRPLALAARLVFEQSYGGVDGDSASSTELYALLSALSEVPIRQSLAVTGSVDQRGAVQAIGGVNEKIEGFFDLCAERGLTGEQGVLIPRANVQHLMLAPRVVDAVRRREFAIYAVDTVDEGIELLTGIAAGRRRDDGQYPPGTINARIEQRLATLAQRARAFSAPASGTTEGAPAQLPRPTEASRGKDS